MLHHLHLIAPHSHPLAHELALRATELAVTGSLVVGVGFGGTLVASRVKPPARRPAIVRVAAHTPTPPFVHGAYAPYGITAVSTAR